MSENYKEKYEALKKAYDSDMSKLMSAGIPMSAHRSPVDNVIHWYTFLDTQLKRLQEENGRLRKFVSDVDHTTDTGGSYRLAKIERLLDELNDSQ